jgi:uncharacterized protein (TIGR02598 family)
MNCDKKLIIYCNDIQSIFFEYPLRYIRQRAREKRMEKLPMIKPRSKKSSGFTLVEVVISMGIMTVTLVPLLGLMANGLSQVGSNIDKNQAVNICQQVFVGAQQGSFTQLVAASVPPSSTATPVPFYFTAEGDSDPAGSASIVYTANVTYTAPAVSKPTPPLVTLQIRILKTPGGNMPPGNPAPVASFVGTISCPDLSGYQLGTD